MKKLSKILRNALLYYFLLTILTGVNVLDGSILSQVIVSLLVGTLFAFVPEVLKFLKLPVTYVAAILISLVISYVFHFLVYVRVASIGYIGSSTINLSSTNVIIFDALETFIVMGLLAAFLMVSLDWLSARK